MKSSTASWVILLCTATATATAAFGQSAALRAPETFQSIANQTER
jgi:hypothetical protein